MIPLHCYTNLDLEMEEWPTKLPAVPRVGDYIESGITHRCNDRGKFRLTLKVVSVTWIARGGGWFCDVELHMRQNHWSITDFYNWYAPLVGKTVGCFI